MDDIESRIREDLKIDETKLGEELQRQAGKYFYWATLRSKAASKSRMQRSFLDALKATKSKDYRESMVKNDPKIRVTERMLDDYLELDEDVTKAKSELVNAQYVEEIFDAAQDAMRQRHYTLIELVRSKESEKIITNEYEAMKKDLEDRESRKRR